MTPAHLDRYGEPIEPDADEPESEHRCRDGWVDYHADRPVPCVRCRPHLRHRPRPPAPDPLTHARGMALVRRALARITKHRNTTEEPER